MKKFTKFIAVAMMFTLCLGYMVTMPFSQKTYVSAEDSAVVGATLTITGLKSTAKIGEKLAIPKGEATGGAEVNVVVKDPRGRTVALQEDEQDHSTYIVPSMLGYYTVQYSAGSITKSQIYSIKVEGTKPTLEFKDNASVYIPETIYAEKSVILPTPSVKINDEELENVVLRSNSESSTVEGKEVVIVSAEDPEYNSVTLTRDANDNLVFSATQKSGSYLYGTYTLKYTYQLSTTGLKVTKYVAVEVDKDYEQYTNKIDLTFVWESGASMPTSAVLGEETTLPMPVAQNKADSNAELQSHVSVTVDFIPNGNLSNEKISYEVDQETLTFTPKNKTENGGYYQIVYTIEDYFGHTITNTYKLSNVSDTVKPEIYLVNDYSVEDAKNGEIDTTDLSYTVPNKIITNSSYDLELPAIYATDNYASFENLELRRIWINGSTQTRLDIKDEDGNYIINTKLSLSSTSESTPDAVKTCLSTPGTYTVRYEAYDGVNTNRSITFEITVLDSALESSVDSTAPRITMPTISKVGFAGNTITFKAPTVVDYASDSLQEVNVDSARCKVEVGYYVGDDYNTFLASYKSGADVSEYEGYYTISKSADDANYYSFDIPSNASYSELHIVVRATDHAHFGAPQQEGSVAKDNVAVSDYTLRVVKTDTNTTAPEFDINQISTELQSSKQNDKVYVVANANKQANQKFTFTGTDQDFTTITVNVYDPSGSLIDVRGASTEVNSDATQITLSGAYFTAGAHGEYVIAITARDVAGNSTVVAYRYQVDAIKPNLTVNGVISSAVTVGETVVLPDCKIDGDLAVDSYYIDFSGYDNPKYTFNHATNEFVALETGTFTFKYVAKNGEYTVETDPITITASANTSEDNKLSFDETDFPSTAKLVLTNETTGEYQAIEIPYLEVLNAVDGIKENSYSVKVVNPDGQELTITRSAEDGIYGSFVPSAKDGTYTVTYTVEDNAGNKAEISKSLAVGDITKPDITIANQDTNLPTSAKLNSTLTIASSDITLDDNMGSDNVTLTITVKDTSGSTTTLSLKDGKYSYTFESAGTYTLTYTAKDKAGNTRTKSTDIVVEAESADTTNTAMVLTGVIIGLVVVLVAGIVIYFVVVNKKTAPKKDSKNNSKKLARKSQEDNLD